MPTYKLWPPLPLVDIDRKPFQILDLQLVAVPPIQNIDQSRQVLAPELVGNEYDAIRQILHFQNAI
jgi:hypothetical protein